MKTVTFDFDETLSKKIVQDYAISLINKGIDVWVLTSRYDDIHKHKYPLNPCNDDLYKIIKKIGIPKYKVRFQCMRPKSEYLFGSNVIWHLDDDYIELNQINIETETIGISVIGNFKKKCNKLLNL